MSTADRAWEAFYGVVPIEAGKKRDGSPRRTLCTLDLVARSKSDVDAITKIDPSIHFVERTMSRNRKRTKKAASR